MLDADVWMMKDIVLKRGKPSLFIKLPRHQSIVRIEKSFGSPTNSFGVRTAPSGFPFEAGGVKGCVE